jgi:hypothetical protein
MQNEISIGRRQRTASSLAEPLQEFAVDSLEIVIAETGKFVDLGDC